MQINLATGALDVSDNQDSWVITSKWAIVEGRDDLILCRGDRISINGDVYRGDEYMGKIALTRSSVMGNEAPPATKDIAKILGQRGGLARAKKLTKAERLESSRKANRAKTKKSRRKKTGRTS